MQRKVYCQCHEVVRVKKYFNIFCLKVSIDKKVSTGFFFQIVEVKIE